MDPVRKKKKILVIGWDAADWKVINPLMDAGLMPALNSLVNQSTISNLATLDPPLSPMLWTSIATGKRPYKHGIIGFTETGEDGKTVKPVTIKNRKCKALWNMLSEEGYKTHVIGWWPSHPAEKINGISISNFYQRASRPINEPWFMQPGTVSPENKAELFAQMRIHPAELTEHHISAFMPRLEKLDDKTRSSVDSLSRIIAENATIHAAATYILEYEEWDFMAVYYDGIDHFNHAFMKYHPPRRPFISEEEYVLHKDIVTAGYRYHDQMLQRLLQLAGDDCTILLISDHGFHPDHQRREFIPREPAGPAAEHSPYGIFCIRGEGIRKDEMIYGSSLLDITPTLLTLLGLPVGEDMDGKSLTAIFEKETIPAFIPTWDEHEFRPIATSGAKDEDQEYIKQLVDLGYIEDPGANKEEAGANTLRNNQFFLARAYIDGNKYLEAVPILESLIMEKPGQARYVMSLCNCYQKLLQFDKIDQTVSAYKKSLEAIYEKVKLKAAEKNETIEAFKIPDAVRAMEATSLISQGHPKKALTILNSISNKKGAGKLFLKKGTCFVMLQDFQNAILEFENELEYNYDEPEAHHGIGYCLLKQQQAENALPHFLNAVGLRFHYPVAHFHLGETFYHMGQFAEAKQAFEVCLKMEPGMNRARMRIAKILNDHFQQTKEAAKVLEDISNNITQTIYVVSGLPRSGTSLMMQMLSAGGMEVFTDGKRESDENNPWGYFEHDAVLRLKRDANWLGSAANKAVKIVSPLLTFLPPRFHYKIIFMERPVMDVMVSQQRMLQHNGKANETTISLNVLNKYQQNLEQIPEWAERNKSNVEILRIPYNDLVSNPGSYTSSIQGFLGMQLDQDKMKATVDRSLHHTKSDVPGGTPVQVTYSEVL